jgi:hypothetical protein
MTLTIEYLKEILEYKQDTGNFIWKIKRGKANIGRVAGTNCHGYMSLRIHQRAYLVHRLAYFYMTGKWPIEIDHINGIKNDNRWCNLREANRSQNNANRKPKNKFKCVWPHKNKWTTQFDRKHLGTFDTPEEAHKAYCDAAYKKFGEFARYE